jgi:hypothetical protein
MKEKSRKKLIRRKEFCQRNFAKGIRGAILRLFLRQRPCLRKSWIVKGVCLWDLTVSQNTRFVVSNWVEANAKKSGASYIVCA